MLYPYTATMPDRKHESTSAAFIVEESTIGSCVVDPIVAVAQEVERVGW